MDIADIFIFPAKPLLSGLRSKLKYKLMQKNNSSAINASKTILITQIEKLDISLDRFRRTKIELKKMNNRDNSIKLSDKLIALRIESELNANRTIIENKMLLLK